jgi:hypothetical protein
MRPDLCEIFTETFSENFPSHAPVHITFVYLHVLNYSNTSGRIVDYQFIHGGFRIFHDENKLSIVKLHVISYTF